MANYPPPYPPPPPGPPYGNDWKYQRRMMKDQARAQRDVMRAQRDAYRYQMRGMRRGSVLGPLLIITVGIIFLLVQTGRLNGHLLWTWYGRWWPALLVTAGVILLLEWAFDQFFHSDSEHPYYRRRVGGGVFTLLLLLGIAGIVGSGFHDGHFMGHAFNQDNMDEFFGDKHESDQMLSQAFPAGYSFSVNNPRGDVTVSGTSDDNQVHVTVHKQVYSRSDSEAEKKAQSLNPNISTDNNTVSVSLPLVESARAEMIVTIPATAATTVTANHGDVHINNIKAAVTATANHGDVEISAITGSVNSHINNGDSSFSAHSVTGQVSIFGRARDLSFTDLSGPLSFEGEFFGNAHIERIRGSVRIHTSRTDFSLARLDGAVEISPNADLSVNQALGPLNLSTRNRNITIERVSGDISVTNRNGSVDLTSAPPLGNVTVENRNGSVNVTVPEQTGFVVQAETTNGDVENDFSLATQGNDTHKNFNGTIGKGGPLIRVNTTQGDIALKQASIAPLPPAPPPPPPLAIRDAEGSTVIIGKDGVRISSGPNGSSVIAGKDGLRITTSPDGSSSYISKSGTSLNSTPDGTTVYISSDGNKYTTSPNGSKSFFGKDGTRITISPDGTKVGIGPGGKVLSDSEISDRLRRADDDVRRTANERNAEQRKDHTASAKNN